MPENKDKKVGRDYPLAPTPDFNKDTIPSRTMFDYGNIYTGDAKSNPGVLKAQSEKKQRDNAAIEHKSKMDKLKYEAILKARNN